MPGLRSYSKECQLPQRKLVPFLLPMNPLIGLLLLLPARSQPSNVSVPKMDKAVIGYVLDEDPALPIADLVDFTKLTHLDIAFANPMGLDGELSVTPHTKQLIELAHQNKVKVSISIGGGLASTTDSERKLYFDLIGDAKRAAFVQRLERYVDEYKLDGIDVDLEGPAIDKDYGAFVSDLAKALKPKGKLLTAAVSRWFGGEQIPNETLGLFDFVNIMAYDATGPWDPSHGGQHSSLAYAKECTDYWLGRGVAKAKLALGVPFYGYGFGNAFNQGGYTFAEITSKYPGAESADQIGDTIWYNGIPTIQAKVKYAVDQGLGGVMIWCLNQDGKGKLSLLSAIHDALESK